MRIRNLTLSLEMLGHYSPFSRRPARLIWLEDPLGKYAPGGPWSS
jgi:hypothetical protein